MRVLIVDDSVALRRIERKMLEGWQSIEIVEARDGLEALQIVAGDKIDLILMDWNMPVLTGIETLKQLKSMDTFSSIPVVLVTSEAAKPRVVEAMGSGAAGYVIKPFTEDVLREKVKPFVSAQAVS